MSSLCLTFIATSRDDVEGLGSALVPVVVSQNENHVVHDITLIVALIYSDFTKIYAPDYPGYYPSLSFLFTQKLSISKL